MKACKPMQPVAPRLQHTRDPASCCRYGCWCMYLVASQTTTSYGLHDPLPGSTAVHVVCLHSACYHQAAADDMCIGFANRLQSKASPGHVSSKSSGCGRCSYTCIGNDSYINRPGAVQLVVQ
jgi:hypothetical protein